MWKRARKKRDRTLFPQNADGYGEYGLVTNALAVPTPRCQLMLMI